MAQEFTQNLKHQDSNFKLKILINSNEVIQKKIF